MNKNRQEMIYQVLSDLEGYKTGYFVTLNALTTNEISHEEKVRKLMYWLGFYCYGRGFKRGEFFLKNVCVNEIGTVNNGLHSHILIMHNNDTSITFEQIERFITKKWLRLVGAKNNVSRFSSLVNIRVVNDIEGCLVYMTKTQSQLHNQFNLQYL